MLLNWNFLLFFLFFRSGGGISLFRLFRLLLLGFVSLLFFGGCRLLFRSDGLSLIGSVCLFCRLSLFCLGSLFF